MPQDKQVFEEKPHQRLITINLLVSAAIYETSEAMNSVALENLCHAIDIFCLFDNAIVLGRGGIPRDWQSDFLDAFEEEKFLSPVDPTPVAVNRIVRTASAHLAPALDISDPESYLDLFRHAWKTETFHTIRTPDQAPRTHEWTALLQEERERSSRMSTFVARSFLYLACADELGFAFTPDVQRNQILTYAADREEVFRGKILQVLSQKYKDFFGGYGDPKLQGKVSPCAAIVFQQAKGKKRSIPWEMKRLRQELALVRARLRILEQEIRSNQSDPYKQREALEKWNGIVDELARSYLQSPWNVSTGKAVRSLLSLTSPLLKVVDLITHPTVKSQLE